MQGGVFPLARENFETDNATFLIVILVNLDSNIDYWEEVESKGYL
jgi:hypothetical protein